MSTFVLLRIENDDEALTFLADMREYPGDPLLTPRQENTVVATVESYGASAAGYSVTASSAYRAALGDVAEMLRGVSAAEVMPLTAEQLTISAPIGRTAELALRHAAYFVTQMPGRQWTDVGHISDEQAMGGDRP
jgi:hypothetical protein